jgi:hypothetical protein
VSHEYSLRSWNGKVRLKRFYELLPWLTEEQKEKIQVIRKDFKAWEDENNPKMADLQFQFENLCRIEREKLLSALRAEEVIITTPNGT